MGQLSKSLMRMISSSCKEVLILKEGVFLKELRKPKNKLKVKK